MAVVRLSGPVLTGPGEQRSSAWVVDGRITFSAPTSGAAAAETTTVAGWVLPGLVDAHCHVGLDAHGAVDPETSERQALADRAAGALLLRDAGSPADTRWVDEREDLPRLVRAGRHLARPTRYIRNFAHEIEPEDLAAYVAVEAQRGDGWVKLVGDWIDRDAGRPDAVLAEVGAGRGDGRGPSSTAPGSLHTASARTRSATWSRPASTASSTAPG